MDDLKHGDKIHPTSHALTGAGDCPGACLPTGNNSKDEVQDDSNSKCSSPGKCEVCGDPSSLFCSICCDSYYCSEEHQKQAWKQHKPKCYPVQRIQIEDQEGKELVVTRDIPQGKVFLKESPILTYPRPSYYSIVCVECCSPILGEGKIFPCTECGLELCSEACQEGVHAGESHHKENECPIFQKWKGKDLPIALQETKIDKYFAIGLIRALLLRERKPKLWERIQKMNSYRKQREMDKDHETVLKAYTSLVQDDFELTDYDEDTINHILGVLSVNSMHVADDSIPKARPSYRHASILFPLCSEAGKNCIPNARFIIKGRYKGNFQLLVTANVPIPKGSPVSFSTEHGLSGTFIRRPTKQKMFSRQCHCERCKDPTELGTFLSALKCKICKDETSYCLQANPLQESSPWKCTNCEGTLEYQEVDSIIEEISAMSVTIKPQACATTTSKKALKAIMEEVHSLLRRLKRTLHPNHFVIINAELDICQRLADVREDNIVKGKEDMVINLAKHILSVADILAPGYSLLRGHALYYLQHANLSNLIKEEALIRKIKGKRSVELRRQGLRKPIIEIRKYQQELRAIFEKVPKDSGEYLMLKSLEMMMTGMFKNY